jgi:hypothetical protein
MDQQIEQQGWIWIDVSDPDQLEKGRTYRIGVGHEHWHLRYGGLHEWFASKIPGEHEIPANALIEAGCPIFMRRQPVSWEGAAHMKYQGDHIVLSDFEGPRMPSQLDQLIVMVRITEILDPRAVPEMELEGDDLWARS